MYDDEEWEEVWEEEQQVCHFYKSSAGCRFGSRCHFLHEIQQVETEHQEGIAKTSLAEEAPFESIAVVSEPSIPKPPIDLQVCSNLFFTEDMCQYYNTSDGCRFGEYCMYEHSPFPSLILPAHVFNETVEKREEPRAIDQGILDLVLGITSEWEQTREALYEEHY